VIGPYDSQRIVLCSLDASPDSQRDEGSAEYFFQKAPWVGAVRNAADRLNCRFVILTGEYGMVNPGEIIKKYDCPLNSETEKKIRIIWEKTIPREIGKDRYDVVVVYFGANPREPILKILKPIIHDIKMDIITFGAPYMKDVGKIEDVFNLITKGVPLNDVRGILMYPDRLRFCTWK
jgi:hypothetical protein